MRSRFLPRRWPVGLGAILALAVSLPAVARAADESAVRLLAPSQGRPVFAAAGETFPVTLYSSERLTEVGFELSTTRLPLPPVELSAVLKWPDAEAGTWRYEITVPSATPDATYDLQVAVPDAVLVAPHAVAVGDVDERLRIVHLSNMNVGTFDVPAFDRRLIDEINLLAPTVIVATGDYLDVSHPDADTGWRQLAAFLQQFDAPVVAACGDHDDLARYTQHLAPSPIGSVAIGPYRGLVLYDVPTRAIGNDADQVAWVERTLRDTDHVLSFVVTHDQRPNLLYHWQADGRLRQMLATGRLGLWFASGHTDWDGAAFKGILQAAGNLQYLRTHQSSPAVGKGAEGVSHYRVVDVIGQRAVHYGPREDDRVGSLAVGKLDVRFDQPNDGSAERVTLLARNRWGFRLDRLMARVLVRRVGTQVPWCRGAELVQVAKTPAAWVCWVRFDLPDQGAVRAVVGTGTPPVEPPVAVHFLVSNELPMRRVRTADDAVYLRADGWVGVVQVQNEGEQPVVVSPLVRLGGEALSYRVVGQEGPVALAYDLTLGPLQVVSLQLDFSAVQVKPGRRELQVYFRGEPALAPVTTPVSVRVVR